MSMHTTSRLAKNMASSAMKVQALFLANVSAKLFSIFEPFSLSSHPISILLASGGIPSGIWLYLWGFVIFLRTSFEPE